MTFRFSKAHIRRNHLLGFVIGKKVDFPKYDQYIVEVIHANLSSVCLLELLEFPQGMEVSEGITIGEGLAAKWLTQTLADAVMGKSFRLGKMAL